MQSATVDLVAEAMLWAADADAALSLPPPWAALPPLPVLREDDTAALSLRDCAALAPGDSPVVLVELTGAELRQWLDRSAEAYQAEPDGLHLRRRGCRRALWYGLHPLSGGF